MVKPRIYFNELSPASRAVLLTVRKLNLDVEKIRVDTLAGEQLRPEFVAINPQHTVPTLVDGDVAVWDSHAIVAYLAAKYAQPGQALYLNNGDADQRALFDQRMHFHHGTLFSAYYSVIRPVFQDGATSFGSPADLERVHSALAFLNGFLQPYILGKSLSVVDIIVATTVNSIRNVLQLDISQHEQVVSWHKKVAAELPEWDTIEEKQVPFLRPIVEQWVKTNAESKK